ncbi:MAG: triphosphoribosyl-dephospho-CoA synthase, partial [Thermoguttaceae bacterium]
PRDVRISEGVGSVLDALDRDDARQVYEAIRLAKPGGLGREAVADVAEGPPSSLIEAMRRAADRDLVARQYANGFHEVLELVVPWLVEADARGQSPDAMIVEVQLRLMCEFPDSLIARKCGAAIARQAQDRAAEVLSVASSVDEAYQRAVSDFDDWLRGDGHRRNPGTTADLIAAGLFVALREGTMGFPSWSKTTAATKIRVKLKKNP